MCGVLEGGPWRKAPRENDTRYRHLLDVFKSKRKLDPYFPDAPTHMDRVFQLEREIPEKRMRQLLTGVLKNGSCVLSSWSRLTAEATMMVTTTIPMALSMASI